MIKLSKRGEITCVHVTAEKIDLSNVDRFLAVIRSAISLERDTEFIVDLSAVQTLAAPGINALVALHKQLQSVGGSLRLRGVPERIYAPTPNAEVDEPPEGQHRCLSRDNQDAARGREVRLSRTSRRCTLKQRRLTRKQFLSRRAIENRLGRILFAEPWAAHHDLYWLKSMKVEARTTVLVLPNRSGQQSMQTAPGRGSLYDSLLAATKACEEKGVIRRLKASEVVVFDLSEHSDQVVVYDVYDMVDLEDAI